MSLDHPRPLGRLIFGGPDLEPRRLRNLLQEQVDRASAGSRIDWCTYYFRDRELAQALMRASDRGVRVRLAMETEPRRKSANETVTAMLQAHGLNGGFHSLSPTGRDGKPGHLHAKIYAFSDPPIAWIGSFNPSGDEPEDADVVAEIGDQDRGHNLLLGIERPKLILALIGYIDQLIEPSPMPIWLRLSAYWRLRDGDTRLFFYPRMRTLIVEPLVAKLRSGDSVRAAISHLKSGPLAKAMAKAARRGAHIDLLVHDTERRVSPKAFHRLAESGAHIRRIVDPDNLPMHAKFILLTGRGRTTAWLGSYNFNDRSRLENAELLLSTSNAKIIAELSERFDAISAMGGSPSA